MKIRIKLIKNIDTIQYSFFKNRFGICLVGSVQDGICNILFADSSEEAVEDLKSRWPNEKLVFKSLPLHVQVKKHLVGTKLISDIQFCVQGTDFQVAVWKALTKIPFGKTSTYKEIAIQINKPLAYRAVGTAISNNPIGYFIPCHRVLKSDAGMGGFRWGIVRKQALITYEAKSKSNLVGKKI